jgi:hypothetical protein
MPAITSFTVNDRESTPVAHTFAPVSLDGNKALFAERGNTAVADKTISIMSRTTTGGYHKVSAKVAVPTVYEDTSSGVSIFELLRKAHVTVECTFAQDATDQEMKNAIAYAAGILAEGQTLLDPVFTERGALY